MADKHGDGPTPNWGKWEIKVRPPLFILMLQLSRCNACRNRRHMLEKSAHKMANQDKSGKWFERTGTVRKVCCRARFATISSALCLPQMMMNFTIIQDCYLNNDGQITKIWVHR